MSSPTFGMSRVISSGPSLVSRASTSCFSMWIEVNVSSRTSFSREQDGVLEVAAFPAHERHQHVLAERQLARVGRRASRPAADRARTRWPRTTIGRWLMQVPWLVRMNLRRRRMCSSPSSSRTTICSP